MDRLARLLDALLAPGVPVAIATHACFAQVVLVACAALVDTTNEGQQLDRWWPGIDLVAGLDRLDPDGLPTHQPALAVAAAAGAFCGLALGRRPCGWAGSVVACVLVAGPWIAPAARLATADLPGMIAPLVVVPAWVAAALITGWRR